MSLLSGCVPLPLIPPKFDPALRWKTVETPHFSIHFHQGEEAVAAEAARHAEEAHPRLTQRLHWTPSGKTQLVLIDHADRVQGEATPFPYNTIYINPYPPAAGILTPIRYENWLRAIIFHEYTHIVQLDQAHRLPKVFRYIFGRAILPNVWQPLWLLEGLATFEESEKPERPTDPTGPSRRCSFEPPFWKIDSNRSIRRIFPTAGPPE
ncbi:MAG: hypothetical protein MPW15_13950 [Candidatus Manganitrophus sp.]|nr:hypothetical protein [Candidatus Manganitrophus sp.]